VMAAVALDPVAARALTRSGLCDSKKFGVGPDARARRAEMAATIRARATFVHLHVISAQEIDRRVAKNELNVLEREYATLLINAAPPCKKIVADGARMFNPLRELFPHLRAYDRGESRHASVAAASVIAKDERDRQFARIAAEWRDDFGEVEGGGYINDVTRAFLRAYLARHGELPREARKSWNCNLNC
jgi:ribonuclease HII